MVGCLVPFVVGRDEELRPGLTSELVRVTDKQRRLDSRRREEETEVFRERYRKRSGIEATNSLLKRVTGLGRLRVRGSPGVFHSILLKVAGWNLLQAARALAMRQKRKIAVALG